MGAEEEEEKVGDGRWAMGDARVRDEGGVPISLGGEGCSPVPTAVEWTSRCMTVLVEQVLVTS